jgi:hypothetical protein
MPLRFEARGAFKAPGSEVRDCDCEEESKKDHRKVRSACRSTKKKRKKTQTQTKKPRLSNTLQKNSSREKTQQLSPPPTHTKEQPSFFASLDSEKRESEE